MNRRNVLGNKIETSKTMWVVMLGILTSVLQFVIYHFMEGNWIGMLLTILVLLLGSVAVHIITGEQDELFAYLMIPLAYAGSMGLMIPWLDAKFLPHSDTALIAALLSWLVPVFYACIYTWAEGHTAIEGFAGFYRKAIILFYLIYFIVLFYSVFTMQKETGAGEMQLIPFATFAAYIDGMIKGTVTLPRLLEFLANRVILFIPYGFFIAMAGRLIHGVLRLVLLLVLPLVLEVVQLVFQLGVCDADDVVFAFLGGLLGMMAFLLFNMLFQMFTGRNYDGSEIDRDYYGRKL